MYLSNFRTSHNASVPIFSIMVGYGKLDLTLYQIKYIIIIINPTARYLSTDVCGRHANPDVTTLFVALIHSRGK